MIQIEELSYSLQHCPYISNPYGEKNLQKKVDQSKKRLKFNPFSFSFLDIYVSNCSVIKVSPIFDNAEKFMNE